MKAKKKRRTKNPHRSVSSVQHYKSALKWYHDVNCKERLPFDSQLDADLDRLIKGYTKKIDRLKSEGRMNLTEGKQPLTFEGYKLLCDAFFRKVPIKSDIGKTKGNNKVGTWAQSIFSWCFLVFMWVLMARSVEVNSVMLTHVAWANDCMVIKTPKHKGRLLQKAGSSSDKDMATAHVFANPNNPILCPVTALAVMTFCNLDRDRKYIELFEGPNQQTRFSKFLRAIMAVMSFAQLAILGALCALDIGNHSTRKGAVSFSLSIPDGPSVIAVFKRAKWSLGFKDRYILFCGGNDHFLGRVLAALSLNKLFASLPPHFTQAGLVELAKHDWNIILPGYDNYPPSFQTTIPFLLASLIWHEPFLRSNLDRAHPLFGTNLFAHGSIMDALRPHVVTGIGRCADTGLEATGVPSQIEIVSEVAFLGEKVKLLEKKIEDGFDKIGKDTQRSISSLKDAVREDMQAIPQQVKSAILENFNVEGVQPVLRSDIDSLAQSINTKIAETVDAKMGLVLNRLESLRPQSAAAASNPESDPSVPAVDQGIRRLGQQYLPEHFTFPRDFPHAIFARCTMEAPLVAFQLDRIVTSHQAISAHMRKSKPCRALDLSSVQLNMWHPFTTSCPMGSASGRSVTVFSVKAFLQRPTAFSLAIVIQMVALLGRAKWQSALFTRIWERRNCSLRVRKEPTVATRELLVKRP